MIKTMKEKFIVKDVCPSAYSHYHSNEHNLASLIGVFFNYPSGYGGKKGFDEILKNVDKSLHNDIFDLYMFACFNEVSCSYILDGKNKYASYFFREPIGLQGGSNKYDENDLLGASLESLRSKVLQSSLFKVNEKYLESENKEYFRDNEQVEKFHRKGDFYTSISTILSCKQFEDIFKENYKISDFRAFSESSMSMELLNLKIQLLNMYGRDENIINKFINVKDSGLSVVGSSMRFNYLWKCISYSPEPNIVDAFIETFEHMKVDGSPDYIKNIDKVLKWVLKNPEFKEKFKNLNNVEDAQNFMAEPDESISFHLYVDALQKLSKKKKGALWKAEGYADMIELILEDLKDVSYFNNYLGIFCRDTDNGEKVITITFKYTDSNRLDVSREDLKKLYESVIIDIVDGNYVLDLSKTKIKLENMVMSLLIPTKEQSKEKVFKV